MIRVVASALVAATALSAAGVSEGAQNRNGHAGTAQALLTLRASEYGKAIFDAHGRALYLFAADHSTKSTCYGACAAAWPPLLTKGTPSVAAGLNAKLLGTTTRTNGSVQVTYNGHPLYYYAADAPGKIMCQHANTNGGFWYVVKADGTANTAKAKHM